MATGTKKNNPIIESAYSRTVAGVERTQMAMEQRKIERDELERRIAEDEDDINSMLLALRELEAILPEGPPTSA